MLIWLFNFVWVIIWIGRRIDDLVLWGNWDKESLNNQRTVSLRERFNSVPWYWLLQQVLPWYGRTVSKARNHGRTDGFRNPAMSSEHYRMYHKSYERRFFFDLRAQWYMMNRFTKCAYQSHIFLTYDGHLTNSTCPQIEKKTSFMVHAIVLWRHCWIPKSISPVVIPCLTDSSSISRKNLLEKSISRNTIKSFS